MANQGERIFADNQGVLRTEFEEGRLIGALDGFDLLLIGLDADGNFVVKIAPEGVDVKTATDDQLVFNSRNNLFKIVKTGSVDLVIPSAASGATANVTQTVPHGLDYQPQVIAFATTPDVGTGGRYTKFFGGSYVAARSVATTGITVGIIRDEQIGTDATNIKFSISLNNGLNTLIASSTVTVKYFILSETAI